MYMEVTRILSERDYKTTEEFVADPTFYRGIESHLDNLRKINEQLEKQDKIILRSVSLDEPNALIITTLYPDQECWTECTRLKDEANGDIIHKHLIEHGYKVEKFYEDIRDM